MHLGAMLHVYKGEWGLPSIDFECVRAMCLVKFTRCPLQIETNANPLLFGIGKLPYLQIGDEKFAGYREIKRVLDNEGYPVDAHLNDKEKSLSASYTSWVFLNLHAYYHYYLFIEPNNFNETRSLYAKRTPFPFNFYYPTTYQKEAKSIVEVLTELDVNDKIENHDTESLIANAKLCVNGLARKLGKQVWFFGDQYSELDAIAYAYLSILLKISLPNNPLQNHIKGCDNLVQFINRISKDLFRNEGYSSTKPSKIKNNNAATSAEEKGLSETSIQILAGVCATIAVTAFTIWRGILLQSRRARETFSTIDYEDADDEDNAGPEDD